MKETNKNHFYGVIGMIALFFVGGIFGYIINGTMRTNNSMMTLSQCQDVAKKIVWAADNNKPDLIVQLNKVFSENCNNRVFKKTKPQPQQKPVVKEQKLPETTCGAVEELLKKELNDEHNMNWESHEYNAKTYKVLAQKGCPENAKKYQQLAQREAEIADVLKKNQEPGVADKSTCEQIEFLLNERLRCNQSYCGNADEHIRDAQIYANLSERGCAGNSAKYKQLAKQELEIARALNDEDMESSYGQNETIEMVETYKRIQMQAEAEKILEKAKKLTNPAIDFIIQLEKIIEE